MIEVKSKLFFVLNTTDYTHKTNNFNRDVFQVDLKTTDSIYVGFKKPISKFYFNHTSVYSNEGKITISKWNGNSWTAILCDDETMGLMRPGFVHFESDNEASTIQTLTGYFYKVTVNINRDALKIAGLNLVFNDDYDLSLEQPLICQPEFLGSQSSFILTNVASRDEILKKLASKNITKSDGSDYNQWDLFDISEVRQSSLYLSLSKIYFNLSDSSDDIWMQKANDYRSKYLDLIEKVSLSLDENDDGIQDKTEIKNFEVFSVKMYR